MKKYLSWTDLLVIVITIILFIGALFTKGFTHDLFLESGILLISVKIILMSVKISRVNQEILKSIDEIKEKVLETKNELMDSCIDGKV